MQKQKGIIQRIIAKAVQHEREAQNLIAIDGRSGAGKSTFSKLFETELSATTEFSTHCVENLE